MPPRRKVPSPWSPRPRNAHEGFWNGLNPAGYPGPEGADCALGIMCCAVAVHPRSESDTPCKLPKVFGQAVTLSDAPAPRRFLATPHRDPWACPRSRSRSAHAAGEARSLETLIGPFRWVDRPLTASLPYSPVLSDHPLAGQTPFCAGNLEPASLEPAPPRGWLNFWRTNIFRRRGLAAAASSSDVIQDARPRQRSQMKGIRTGRDRKSTRLNSSH